MASITIRNLDEQTKARLRVRAAHHGHSMEDEARLSAATKSRPLVSVPVRPLDSLDTPLWRLLGTNDLTQANECICLVES